MNWSIAKNSRQYKFPVVSKEQNNPTLQQKSILALVYLRKQTTTSPVIDPFAASFSKSFCGTASSCVFSTPEKNWKKRWITEKIVKIEKINDPIWEALHLVCVIYYKPKFSWTGSLSFSFSKRETQQHVKKSWLVNKFSLLVTQDTYEYHSVENMNAVIKV